MLKKKLLFFIFSILFIHCHNIGYKELKVKPKPTDVTFFFDLTDILKEIDRSGIYFRIQNGDQTIAKVMRLNKPFVQFTSDEKITELKIRIIVSNATPFVGSVYTTTQNELNPDDDLNKYLHSFNGGEYYEFKKGQVLSFKLKLDKNILKSTYENRFRLSGIPGLELIGFLTPLWPMGEFPIRMFRRISYDFFEDSSELLNDVSKQNPVHYGKLTEISSEKILEFSSVKRVTIGEILHVSRNNKTFAKVVVTNQGTDWVEGYLVSIIDGEKVSIGDRLVKLSNKKTTK